MRKITSKEEEGRGRRRNQIVVGVILVGVMVISTLGYAFQTQDTPPTNAGKVEYNGYEFLSQNGLWFVAIGNLQFAFLNNPNQVEKIDSPVNLLDKYSGQVLYVSSENQNAELEIYRNLDQIILRRQYACLENETCADENFPIKTCQDNFLIIKEAEISEIKQEENCVFIKGSKENLPKIADEFLFKILGIE